MDFEKNKIDIERRMDGALDVLNREFSGLRTGRASVGLLEPITVEAYGQQMPINQVGTINLAEARLLTVQVWDKSLVASVEKSIRDSNLGLNPVTEGTSIRVPIPSLSEERRLEITKVAGKYAEDCRIALRNVRRNAMDELKKLEKGNQISQDERRDYEVEIQTLTNEFVTKVDKALENKEQEILQV